MQSNGNTAWQETPAGQKVMHTFTEERTLQALEKLLSRIDTLEKAVADLSDVMQRGPGLVAMVGDMVDEGYRKADSQGINIEERLQNALSVAEKLTTPAMVEKLDAVISMTNQMPGMVAMVGDMVDEGYRKADDRGVNIQERLETGLAIAEKLTAPAMAQKLDSMMQLADQAPGLIAMVGDMVDEGMKNAMDKGFDPQSMGETLNIMGLAMTKAKAEPPAKAGGIFGLLRALNDNDRQKGMGFLMNFLKHLGKGL